MNKKTYACALLLVGAVASPVTSAGAMPFDRNLATLGRESSSRQAIIRVQGTEAVLAPMAHIVFCNAHKDQCESRTPELLRNDERTFNALLRVNHQVNDAIEPMQRNAGLIGTWQIGPSAGDCNDFAVTKRERLIRLGFPASALLLAHVVTNWGEHHLVLVARTDAADFVLDNLREDIRRVEKAGYRWVRIQSPTQATMWNTARIKRDPAPAAPDEPIMAEFKPARPASGRTIARNDTTNPSQEKSAEAKPVASPALQTTASAESDKWVKTGPAVAYASLSSDGDNEFAREIRIVPDQMLF